MPTTLDPLATVDALEVRVGPIDPDSFNNALSLLRYASSLVRAFGNREWDDPDTNPHQLVEVVVGMVERARDNPQGVTQDTAGPFTVSFGPAAAQRVYLTAGDRKIIRSVAGLGAYTVDMTPQATYDALAGVVVNSDDPPGS